MAYPVNVFRLTRFAALDSYVTDVSCQIPFEVRRMRIKIRFALDQAAAPEDSEDFCYELWCDQLSQPVGHALANSSTESDYYFPIPTAVRNTLTFRLRMPPVSSSNPVNSVAVFQSFLGLELTFYPADQPVM